MAALFARVARKRFNFKNILPSSSKRCISVGPHLDVTYKTHVQINCTSLLHARCVKRVSPFLGARHYSDGSGASNLGDLIGNNTTLENPFITENQQTAVDAVQTLNSLGEPTLSSLGLGGWSPSGIVQQTMELIHTSCGLPWFWTIVATTVVFRLLMVPVAVKCQANTARLNNIKPEMEALQAQIKELSRNNDKVGSATAVYNLQQLMKENRCNPAVSLLGMLVQVPVFVSLFFGIKGMAGLPVESFQTGGILWFSDLTLPDPYFILPIMNAMAMLSTLEIGDGLGISTPQAQTMKSVFRVMTMVTIPVIAFFNTGLLVFWTTSSLFNLCQVWLLKLKTMRQFFDIPDIIIHKDQGKPVGKVFETVKENFNLTEGSAYMGHYENMKTQNQSTVDTIPVEPKYKHKPRIKFNQQIFSPPDKSDKNDKLKDKPDPKMC